MKPTPTLLLTLALGISQAGAAITAGQARRAIVGEAAGAGYTVQLGVACALRNRGHLRGVYGVNARHNATEPQWVWDQAARAWTESATRDVTGGADHFGCESDVRKGTFRGMTLTVVLGEGRNKTYFYRKAKP